MSSTSGRILTRVLRSSVKRKSVESNLHTTKTSQETFTATDAVKPVPSKTKITTLCGAAVAVGIGISTGAHISKNIASFLEENELFVPSDDDDDD